MNGNVTHEDVMNEGEIVLQDFIHMHMIPIYDADDAQLKQYKTYCNNQLVQFVEDMLAPASNTGDIKGTVSVEMCRIYLELRRLGNYIKWFVKTHDTCRDENMAKLRQTAIETIALFKPDVFTLLETQNVMVLHTLFIENILDYIHLQNMVDVYETVLKDSDNMDDWYETLLAHPTMIKKLDNLHDADLIGVDDVKRKMNILSKTIIRLR
jgi:hypothetical protein